ncbi:glycosyltransferase [Streptococcus suis]|uniref:Glycosyltransferase n=1 Tax=Streptococcus suis TaxID=1307 RepID=A0A4T2H997_STRSU|nr:glycosyltransferase [Streptococcus suis]TII07827.1 glycosyltransferase [Streptococcus suis]
MTVYTVRRSMSPKMFGYESTQTYRHAILKKHGIANKFLVTTPFVLEFGYQRLRAMGFEPEDVILLPNVYSDMDTTAFTYTISDFEQTLEVGVKLLQEGPQYKIYKVADGFIDVDTNVDGFVVSILHRNANLEIISSTFCFQGPYYTVYGNEERSFEYYNRDGSIALSGYFQNTEKNPSVIYQLNGEKLTEADLVIRHLEEHGKENDVILNDQLQFHFPRLIAYAEKKRMIYRDVLHYNHYYALETYSNYHTILPHKLLTASPYLNQRLVEEGYDATFVHPVGVTVASHPPVGLSSNKILLSSHFNKGKRVEMAIEAFRQVPELELHIYGGMANEVEQFKKTHSIPENVVLKGFVDTALIPRHTYAAYLSCSISEMYANAMVESLGVGVIPLLSKIDYGHNQVLEKLNYGTGFDTVEELVDVLKKFANWKEDYRREISEKVLEIAQEFSNEEAEGALLNWLKTVGSGDVE